MNNVPTRTQIDRAASLAFDGVTHGDDPQLEENAHAKFARKRAEAQKATAALNQDVVGKAPLGTLPDPPAVAPAPDLPTIEIQTTVEHRGRAFTVVARGYTLDQLCDMLDKRGYAAPSQTQEWQTLPDGTPICPKHHTPMRLRERQGDKWWSHNVGKGSDGKDIYCKGYHGKDSPGYEVN